MFEREFKSKINGIEPVLCFRQLNLADEAWIQETYPNFINDSGKDKIDLKMFAAILFRQLKNKDVFQPYRKVVTDDNGEKSTITVGGLNLFMEMILGDEGKIDVMESFTAVCAMSRPDAVKAEEDEVKKKRTSNQVIFGASLLLLLGLLGGAYAIFGHYL